MIYQPVLNQKILENTGIRFNIRHIKKFEEINDPEHDESHIHGCYEIYFNISGNVSFWANNRLYPIKSGDMIVTKPGDVHLCVYNGPSIHEHFCLWIELGEAAQNSLADFFSKNYYSFGEKRGKIYELFLRLEAESIDGADEFMRTAAIFELMAYLAKGAPEHSAKAPEALPHEMQKIIDDLNENFTKFNHISDIVDRYYISRATLNRWFRKYLHISLREFLEAKKLSFAKRLLEEGKTVTEACMLAGFSDCSHFIAVFKKKFGATPLKYKNSSNRV